MRVSLEVVSLAILWALSCLTGAFGVWRIRNRKYWSGVLLCLFVVAQPLSFIADFYLLETFKSFDLGEEVLSRRMKNYLTVINSDTIPIKIKGLVAHIAARTIFLNEGKITDVIDSSGAKVPFMPDSSLMNDVDDEAKYYLEKRHIGLLIFLWILLIPISIVVGVKIPRTKPAPSGT